jgi:hypothetical protein
VTAATIEALARLSSAELAAAADAYVARFGSDEARDVFCGNLDCSTRRPGSLTAFTLDRARLVDGRVWVCTPCRSSDVAAAWPARLPCPCETVYDHHHSATPDEVPAPPESVTRPGSCLVCGAPTPRANARYCSDAHRQAAYRARRDPEG